MTYPELVSNLEWWNFYTKDCLECFDCISAQWRSAASTQILLYSKTFWFLNHIMQSSMAILKIIVNFNNEISCENGLFYCRIKLIYYLVNLLGYRFCLSLHIMWKCVYISFFNKGTSFITVKSWSREKNWG